MGDTRRKPPHGFHLLRLNQLLVRACKIVMGIHQLLVQVLKILFRLSPCGEIRRNTSDRIDLPPEVPHWKLHGYVVSVTIRMTYHFLELHRMASLHHQ